MSSKLSNAPSDETGLSRSDKLNGAASNSGNSNHNLLGRTRHTITPQDQASDDEPILLSNAALQAYNAMRGPCNGFGQDEEDPLLNRVRLQAELDQEQDRDPAGGENDVRRKLIEVDRVLQSNASSERSPQTSVFELQRLPAAYFCPSPGTDNSDFEVDENDKPHPGDRISPDTFKAFARGCKRWKKTADIIKEIPVKVYQTITHQIQQLEDALSVADFLSLAQSDDGGYLGGLDGQDHPESPHWPYSLQFKIPPAQVPYGRVVWRRGSSENLRHLAKKHKQQAKGPGPRDRAPPPPILPGQEASVDQQQQHHHHFPPVVLHAPVPHHPISSTFYARFGLDNPAVLHTGPPNIANMNAAGAMLVGNGAAHPMPQYHHPNYASYQQQLHQPGRDQQEVYHAQGYSFLPPAAQIPSAPVRGFATLYTPYASGQSVASTRSPMMFPPLPPAPSQAAIPCEARDDHDSHDHDFGCGGNVMPFYRHQSPVQIPEAQEVQAFEAAYQQQQKQQLVEQQQAISVPPSSGREGGSSSTVLLNGSANTVVYRGQGGTEYEVIE